jgi:metallo-beta-lactamase family protein
MVPIHPRRRVSRLETQPGAPRQTFITHDGPAAAAALRLRIEHELKRACQLPYYLESVSLD